MDSAKPPKVAVGLRYKGQAAETPALSVREFGVNAEQVQRLAQRFGIPVIEQEQLARSLSTLQLDQEIPQEYFEAVALVLCKLAR